MSTSTSPSFWQRSAPAFTLMLFAPLIAEALQGATRPSVYIGFPLIFLFEVAVWGGAAVFMRFLTRRLGLGWINLLLLGLALAVAEEFIIQQTSIAPLVIKLKGVEYARAFGVNYVYLMWSLCYESVFVVLVPVALAEFVFPDRREDSWLSTGGLLFLAPFFAVGASGAWFSWTQIARINVFHMAPYHPPLHLLLIGGTCIVVLFIIAIGPCRQAIAQPAKPIAPPPPWLLAILGAIFAACLMGLAAIAFGVNPALPPIWVICGAALLFVMALWLTPRWAAHQRWQEMHRYGLVSGAAVGNMAAGYLGYIGATPLDFWGKTIIDIIATALLIRLGLVVHRRNINLASQ
ncbi:MAG: hypothetical protein ABUL58_03935 [Steroidobacter sp.]